MSALAPRWASPALILCLLAGCAAGLPGAGDPGATPSARSWRVAARPEAAPVEPLSRPGVAPESGERHLEATPDGPAPGPVKAAELEEIGFADIDEEGLALFRAEDWRPDAGLPHTEARAAFLARSRAVSAAAQRHRAARTRFDQVDNLLQLVRLFDSFAFDLRTDATTPVVMPKGAPWPPLGMEAVRSRLIEADVQASQGRFAREVLEALLSFEESFQEFVYQVESESVSVARIDLAATALSSAQGAYRAGRADLTGVLQAQARLDEWREVHRSTEERVVAARQRLAAALDLPGAALDGVSVFLDTPPSDVPARPALLEGVARSAPELKIGRAMAERAALMVALVERRLLPDLSPGAALSRDGDTPRAMPPWRFASGAPYLVELRLMQEAAEESLAAAERSVPAEAAARFSALSDVARRLELESSAQLDRAGQSVETAEASYRAGRIGYSELDRALRANLEVGLNVHRLRRDLEVARARLLVTTGKGVEQ